MKIIKLTGALLLLISVTVTPAGLTAASNFSRTAESAESGPHIAFNFVDVEISAVIKFISEITGYNFLYDDRIKGKVTIIAPTKLSLDESFNLFTSVLGMKGFTIIPAGPETYKIIPSSLAKQEGVISPDETFPVNEGYITKLMLIDHIDAEEALQFLRPVLSRDGHIAAFGPRNMLLVVDSAVNIDKIRSILKLIDKPTAVTEEVQIHVHFLEHADATDLSQVLQGIIKELQTSYKTARRIQKDGSEPPPVISVTPDKATNSLVIVAPQTDYENILQVIRTLDKKRKQVFVEAMIVEARIDKLRDIGSKWRATAVHNNEPVLIGGLGTVDTGTVFDIITGLSGLSAGGLANFIDIPVTSISDTGSATSQTLTAPGFAALFSLSDFQDAINVLSTPQILTSDNEEAEIFVGENVPFISQRERDVTTTNTVLNSIVRTDAGIKLQIKPQITEGDYVKLDIFQEISAVKNTTEAILTTVGPTTTKRSTKTSVIVKDGRTVVIGGLMEERDEENTVKVPILGDIPVLEWLFKFKSVSRNKTNLLIFLSPHVVKESSNLSELTEQKHKEFVTGEKFYRTGELLVQFKDDVKKEDARALISRMGARVIEKNESTNLYHISISKHEDVEEAVAEFSRFPEVMYAEPNYKVKLPPVSEVSDENNPAPAPAPPFYDGSTAEEEQPALLLNQKPEPSPVKSSIAESDGGQGSYTGGEILVKFIEGVTKEQAQEIIDRQGASILKHFKSINVYYLKLGPGQGIEDSLRSFSSLPEVRYAEPNYRVRIPAPPEKTEKKKPAPEGRLQTPEKDLPREGLSSLRHSALTSDAESGGPSGHAVSGDTGELLPSPPERTDGSLPREAGEETFSVPSSGESVPAPGGTEPVSRNISDTSYAALNERVGSLGKKHYIQIGSWKNFTYAKEALDTLKSTYKDIYMVKEGRFHKVRIPGKASKKEDITLMKNLRDNFQLKPLLVDTGI